MKASDRFLIHLSRAVAPYTPPWVWAKAHRCAVIREAIMVINSQERAARELRAEVGRLRRRNFALECAVSDSSLRSGHAARIEDALDVMATDKRSLTTIPEGWSDDGDQASH